MAAVNNNDEELLIEAVRMYPFLYDASHSSYHDNRKKDKAWRQISEQFEQWTVTVYSEKDIDEVLQTHTVFTNVSKGHVAKKEDLVKVFNTDDQTEVCKEILTKGELQVSDKERAAHLSALFKETANIVSEKCVNPETKRPYPMSIIENAMREAHFSVKANRNAKQHALDVIPKLKAIIPIERALMRVRVRSCSNEAGKLKESLSNIASNIEYEHWSGPELTMVFLIDPGFYRKIEELTNSAKGGGLMEVLDLKEVTEGDEFLT